MPVSRYRAKRILASWSEEQFDRALDAASADIAVRACHYSLLVACMLAGLMPVLLMAALADQIEQLPFSTRLIVALSAMAALFAWLRWGVGRLLRHAARLVERRTMRRMLESIEQGALR